MSDVVWRPNEGYIERANVTRFMRAHGIGIFNPYDGVLDTCEGIAWSKWFVGGRINLAHVTCDVWAERTPDRVAVISEGEDGEVRRVTYRELREMADRLAHGLL